MYAHIYVYINAYYYNEAKGEHREICNISTFIEKDAREKHGRRNMQSPFDFHHSIRRIELNPDLGRSLIGITSGLWKWWLIYELLLFRSFDILIWWYIKSKANLSNYWLSIKVYH